MINKSIGIAQNSLEENNIQYNHSKEQMRKISTEDFLYSHNNTVLNQVYDSMVHLMTVFKASKLPRNTMERDMVLFGNNYNKMLDAASRHFFATELRLH